MDPDANLAEQLELARSVTDDDLVHGRCHDDAERLAELVIALHEWIENGGALPQAWERAVC